MICSFCGAESGIHGNTVYHQKIDLCYACSRSLLIIRSGLGREISHRPYDKGFWRIFAAYKMTLREKEYYFVIWVLQHFFPRDIVTLIVDYLLVERWQVMPELMKIRGDDECHYLSQQVNGKECTWFKSFIVRD